MPFQREAGASGRAHAAGESVEQIPAGEGCAEDDRAEDHEDDCGFHAR